LFSEKLANGSLFCHELKKNSRKVWEKKWQKRCTNRDTGPKSRARRVSKSVIQRREIEMSLPRKTKKPE